MSKRFLMGTCMALIVFGALASAHKAYAVTENGSIEAVILEPIVLSAADTLDFGDISPGTAASTVTIAPGTGARTLASGDAQLVAGGGEQDGTFNLDGADGEIVTIDVPADGSITVLSGADSMDVDGFTWTYNGGAATVGDGTATLAVGGAPGHTLSVGATISVTNTQAAGTYTGSFPVTVLYQ